MSCPICKKDTNPEFKPFCCKRCADVDLNRWFNGIYKVETEEYASPEDYESIMQEQLKNMQNQ